MAINVRRVKNKIDNHVHTVFCYQATYCPDSLIFLTSPGNARIVGYHGSNNGEDEIFRAHPAGHQGLPILLCGGKAAGAWR